MTTAADLVEQYGKDAKESLIGPGDPEAALSQPVTNFLRGYGQDVRGSTRFFTRKFAKMPVPSDLTLA